MSFGDDAKLGSGLPDRFLLSIRQARMKTPEGWNNPVVVLEGEQNVDGEVEDGDVRLSVGAFEAGDKEGTFLVHETQNPSVYEPGSSDKKKKINKNSQYGRFLESALQVGQDVLENNQSPDREKYSIWDLLFWEGLTVDVEMIERKFTYQEGHPKAGEEGTTRDAFVRGVFPTGEGATGATTSTTAAPNTAASTNGQAPDPKAYDTHMEYVAAGVNAGIAPSDLLDKEAWDAARTS